MKNLLCSIATIASIATATSIISSAAYAADSKATVTFDQGQGLPLHLEAPTSYEVTVNFGKTFSSIEVVCFWAKYEDDLLDVGDSMTLSVPYTPLETTGLELLWSNDGAEAQNHREFCTMAWNLEPAFLDGEHSFTISMTNGEATLKSLDVTITGEESSSLQTFGVGITLDAGEGLVAATGGRVKYDASIENIDLLSSYKDYIQWSVLSFPDGQEYPIHKSRKVQLGAGESKEYTRTYLNIHSWFPAGEYSLTWYVADPLDGAIISDKLEFTKTNP
ncbi:hypothetical protein EDC56_1285 [Sinobacterium caligoides]|uniref:Cohesin domain-containing protein n=1 Tax=Sinobacterium caligoides TaxID=933926 RepID=A0A3N2E0X0_9GAMM|nr:hypothetical protein [Sinobacterium caligoides]ROS05734.1 hypothetical protein EDC56_1285 [Sinobacterium caligoides]